MEEKEVESVESLELPRRMWLNNAEVEVVIPFEIRKYKRNLPDAFIVATREKEYGSAIYARDMEIPKSERGYSYTLLGVLNPDTKGVEIKR